MKNKRNAAPRFDRFQTRSQTVKWFMNATFLLNCIFFTSLALLVLAILLISIFSQGMPHLSKDFMVNPPNSDAELAGIGPALMGTIWVCLGCAIFALPIGIGTAIMLEEFQPRNRILKKLHGLVQINITNLAGVPSIVYGILGLTAFVSMFGLFGKPSDPPVEFGVEWFDQIVNDADQVIHVYVDSKDAAPTELTHGQIVTTKKGEQLEVNILNLMDDLPEDKELLKRSFWEYDLDQGVARADKADRQPNESWYYFRLPFGRGVIAASLTLMLVILPVIIVASQEALRAVPSSLREGALGLGSTQWQVVRRVTLPASIPGIMTGSILAFSRAIGEAAPILIILGIVDIPEGPQHLMDEFIVMPLQLYYWAGLPDKANAAVQFQEITSAGIIVLLAILLSFNAVAIAIRQFTQKKLS